MENDNLEGVDEQPTGDLEQDSQEILQKISDFQSNHSSQLSDFNKFYKQYRSIPTKTRRENQSNTFIPELFVEDEALATAVHEMIFSDNTEAQFFDVVGEDGGMEDMVRAMVTKATLTKQTELIDLSPKILPFLRMVILQGMYPVAMPWRLEYKTYWDNLARVRRPAFDSWDFEPFDVVNFSFDDTEADINRRSFNAQTSHIKRKDALHMVRMGIWNKNAVEDSVKDGIQRNVYDQTKRQIAGYFDSGGKGDGFTAHLYYGTLDSRDDGEMYRAWVTNQGKFLSEPEINPYNHGESEFLACEWFSLPGEAYAMGIGHINTRTQSEINDRRNFINDMLYASLYCQWLNRTDSGLQFPGGKMKWSPHQVINGDGITDEFLRPLRPDMSPLGPAVNMEAADIEKMRRQSGATTTLQAIATGVTATESQSIQSEATRRVKAMVRSNVASFMRKVLYRAHALNLQFLDRPFSARINHGDGYQIFGKVSREDQITNPDIRMKMTTDLDFRPFKRKELLEMLDIFSRLQKDGLLGQRRIIPDPIVEELAQTYGMDPRKFFSREGMIESETRRATQDPAVQAKAMQQVVQESPMAQQVLGAAQ